MVCGAVRAGPPRRPACLLSLVLTAGGCRMPEPAGPKIGLDVGLKRGGSWTTFNVRPSRVIGPTVSLEMRRGQIVGSLDNSTVKLTAKADEVTGVAGGRVALDVEEYDGKVEISGVWNDDRVHFEVTPESLRGTITGSLNAFNQPSDAYRRRDGPRAIRLAVPVRARPGRAGRRPLGRVHLQRHARTDPPRIPQRRREVAGPGRDGGGAAGAAGVGRRRPISDEADVLMSHPASQWTRAWNGSPARISASRRLSSSRRSVSSASLAVRAASSRKISAWRSSALARAR